MSNRPWSAPFQALALALVLGVAGAGLAGCRKDKEIDLTQVPQVNENDLLKEQRIPTEVAVNPEVSRAWKSVVLEVKDKDTGKAETFTVGIGQTAPLGKTGLTVWVEAFLPSFAMQGDKFTAPTMDLDNPAARVKITDGAGKQLFYSWLFALYPTTHPFEHPRYSVTLKDYKKA